jgi:hypothetical protein
MIVFYSRPGSGGYGDRLCGLGCTLAVAKILGHEFRVVWEEDLSDIFSDYIGVDDLVYDETYYFIDSHALKAKEVFENLDPKDWKNKTIRIQTNQPIHYYLYRNLDKSFDDITREAFVEIYREYLKCSIDFMKCNVGVQIRCGDMYMTGNKHVYLDHPTLLTLVKNLSNSYPADTEMYVTADWKVAIEEMKGAFPNTSFHDWERVHFDMNCPDSTAMAQIVAEHLSLCQCKEIVMGNSSNFGYTAVLIGNPERVIKYHVDLGKTITCLERIDPRKRLLLKSNVSRM